MRHQTACLVEANAGVSPEEPDPNWTTRWWRCYGGGCFASSHCPPGTLHCPGQELQVTPDHPSEDWGSTKRGSCNVTVTLDGFQQIHQVIVGGGELGGWGGRNGRILGWPSQSSGLNHIKMRWGNLKQAAKATKPPPRALHNLKRTWGRDLPRQSRFPSQPHLL